MGLILGNHVIGNPSATDASSDTAHNNNAKSSPLLAATSKISNSDIQKLIRESAEAEVVEKKEHELEAEALRHGDKALAAHLRGVLAPGDKNYNPHHHVDDVMGVGDDGVSGEGGGGNGAMYADGDGSSSVIEETKGKTHSKFAEKLKNELAHMKESQQKIVKSMMEGEHKIVESMHHKFKEAMKSEQVVESIKSGVKEIISHGGLRGGGESSTGGAGKSLSSFEEGGGAGYYPYMVAPVPENYDFKTYEPLGGGRFLEYKDGDSPYASSQKLRDQSDELARSRRVHVLNGMKHIWKNYKEFAFGRDELHPISKKATSNWGGMGTT